MFKISASTSKTLTLGFALLYALSVHAESSPRSAATATSAVTTKVIGRAPTAAPTLAAGTPPTGSAIVTVNFSDLDGDAQSGSLFEWYRYGALIGGATGSSLLLDQSGIGGDRLYARVTPKTDPNITSPSEGTATNTTEIAVPSGAILSRFIMPLTTGQAWSNADAYCNALGSGARLPALAELQEVFADTTSSPTNHPNSGYVTNLEMCSKHGWPLNGQCGGSSYGYWSSTPGSAGNHYNVSLRNGSASSYSDSLTYQVACIR